MATKTGVTARVRFLAEVFDDDAAGSGGENVVQSTVEHMFEWMYPLSCGTGDGQVNLVWSDRGSIAASATTLLDLAGGLTDNYGHVLTFSHVKGLVLRNRSTATVDTLNLGPGASNGWLGFWSALTARSICKAGMSGQPGWLCFYDPVGIPVTAGSADILALIEAGATNTVAYDILIIGKGTYV